MAALEMLRRETVNKLSTDELAAIENQFTEVLDQLKLLEEGKIYIGLFGATNAGKSATLNALVEKDLAQVGQRVDLTSGVNHFEQGPWVITDMPGVMGKRDFERIALDAAKRCHGHIFVINGEPYGPELELFEAVHRALPHTPKIVFVNKWDVAEATKTRAEREELPRLIAAKMGKFVKSPADIVYGSAERIVDGERVRQKLPQLLERMHADAGTLGLVMNVLHPAERSAQLSEMVHQRVWEVRLKVARRVVNDFATATAGMGVIPFGSLLGAPGILAGMVYTLSRILGKGKDRQVIEGLTRDLIKACAAELGIEFVGEQTAEFLASLAAFVPAAGILAVGALGGMGYLRYKRATILGEVAIEYIKNDGWGGESPHAVILRCRERAKAYLKLVRGNVEISA